MGVVILGDGPDSTLRVKPFDGVPFVCMIFPLINASKCYVLVAIDTWTGLGDSLRPRPQIPAATTRVRPAVT